MPAATRPVLEVNLFWNGRAVAVVPIDLNALNTGNLPESVRLELHLAGDVALLAATGDTIVRELDLEAEPIPFSSSSGTYQLASGSAEAAYQFSDSWVTTCIDDATGQLIGFLTMEGTGGSFRNDGSPEAPDLGAGEPPVDPPFIVE